MHFAPSHTTHCVASTMWQHQGTFTSPHPTRSQTLIPTMFASSMNVTIPPHTIHCVASTMIMSAIKFKDRPQRRLWGSLRTVITSAPPHHIHCVHISTVCVRLRNGNIPPPHTIHCVASNMFASSRNGPPATPMRSMCASSRHKTWRGQKHETLLNEDAWAIRKE